MLNNVKSARLTKGITLVLLVLTVPTAAAMPYLLKLYMTATGKPELLITPLLVTFYLMCIPAVAVLLCLFLLLRNIAKSDVFIRKNILYLRLISWCCVLAGIISLASGFYYLPFILFAAAALFLALIVQVVKNIIAQAIDIKSENDFTI